ncbi:MAG: hypothetical protein MJZ52_07315 [Bacteroidales bacterium]|nr:hypothetical protein [Bacteroidales bacterium]
MKKLLISILFCFVIINIFGQSKQLREYYYWTNQAELAICDSDYNKANACYDTAFSLKIPFTKDLFSAYLLNLKLTQNLEKIGIYAKYLVQYGDDGLSERYARDCEVDSQIYKQLQFIETNYHSLCDTSLEHSLEEIGQKDQSYPHSGGHNAFEDSMDYAVIRAIKELSDQHNINIQTVGIYALYNLYAPAIHYVHACRRDLQKIYKKHVLKGNIGADMYMHLEDEYLCCIQIYKSLKSTVKDPNGYGQGNFYFRQIGNTVFITYPLDIKLVNKHRKSLGLSETFEDLVKKISWEYTHDILRWHSITKTKLDNADETENWKKEIEEEHAAGDFHRIYFDIPKSK